MATASTYRSGWSWRGVVTLSGIVRKTETTDLISTFLDCPGKIKLVFLLPYPAFWKTPAQHYSVLHTMFCKFTENMKSCMVWCLRSTCWVMIHDCRQYLFRWWRRKAKQHITSTSWKAASTIDYALFRTSLSLRTEWLSVIFINSCKQSTVCAIWLFLKLCNTQSRIRMLYF